MIPIGKSERSDMEFSRPRSSSIADPLLRLAERGELSPEHLAQVKLKVDRLNQQLADQLQEEDDDEVEEFRIGMLDALSDAFTVMHYGLDELSQFQVGEDPAPLRVGRLLLEKGESEYLSILKEVGRTERSSRPGERTSNWWGQLLESLKAADEDEVGPVIQSARSTVQDHLDGTARDFSQALEIVRTDPEEAQRKLLISLLRFREFLGLWPS